MHGCAAASSAQLSSLFDTRCVAPIRLDCVDPSFAPQITAFIHTQSAETYALWRNAAGVRWNSGDSELLLSGAALTVVAIADESTCIGFAAAVPDAATPKMLEVTVVVTDSYRNLGVANALMATIEVETRHVKPKAWYAHVAPHNTAACRLFERRGFSCDQSRDIWSKQADDEAPPHRLQRLLKMHDQLLTLQRGPVALRFPL